MESKLLNCPICPYCQTPTSVTDAYFHRPDPVKLQLAESLKEFLEDPRFDIAVGGNPHAVDLMLQRAQAALAAYQAESTSAGRA